MPGISRLVTALVLISSSLVAHASTVAKVTTFSGEELQNDGVGALVAKERLLVSYQLVAQVNQIQVLDGQTGARLIGRVSASSKETDLAIIEVTGLTGTPFVLASNTTEVGGKIYLQIDSYNIREGMVHSVLSADKDSAFKRMRHTLPVAKGEFGAPVLNNCKQLAGVSQHKTQGWRKFDLLPDTLLGTATQLEAIKKFLSENEVAFSEGAEACLSETVMVERLNEEKQKQREAIEQAESEKKKKEVEIDKLTAEKEQTRKALELAEKAAQDREQALLEAEDRTAEQEAELKRIEEEKIQQEEKLKAIEAEREKTDAERAEERKKQTVISMVAGVAFLLFVLIVVILLLKRKQQLQRVQKKGESVEHELSVERAKYEAVQEELKSASATFNDIVFVGKDEAAVEHRVKIVGNALARMPQGVVLGRSAANANVVLNVPGVSREHLMLRLVDGQVFIEDLGSFNGTAVNAKALIKGESTAIQHGDELRIGTVNGQILFLD